MFDPVVSVCPHLCRCGCLRCYRIHSLSLSAALSSSRPPNTGYGLPVVLHGHRYGDCVLTGLPTDVLRGVLQTESR